MTFGSITYIGASIVGINVGQSVWSRYYYYQDNYYNYSTSIYGGLLMSRYIIYGIGEGNFEENNQDALTIVDAIKVLILGSRMDSFTVTGQRIQSKIGGRSAFSLFL
jgi:hypothetical protein